MRILYLQHILIQMSQVSNAEQLTLGNWLLHSTVQT